MFPNFHFSVELWRKNTEYGVWVSNQGRIKLIKNKTILEPRIDCSGYCQVFTQCGAISVHRLVAYTWLGDKRNEKYTVDHINSNKRDNSVKNLRWVSAEVNTAYACFTQSCITVEETHPQTAVEEDEQLLVSLWNNALGEEIRGRALRALFNSGKIKIRTSAGDIPNEESLLKISQKFANNVELIKFYGRILKASAKKEKYCNLLWYVEAAND